MAFRTERNFGEGEGGGFIDGKKRRKPTRKYDVWGTHKSNGEGNSDGDDNGGPSPILYRIGSG